MYPSGPWRGYWEQPIYGRQAMSSLLLTFSNGEISGTGVDCIGPFSFQGRYDEQGSVALIKQYVGRHIVLYQGRYDGEGTIAGRWSIGDAWSGPFALSPEHFVVPDNVAIRAIEPAPSS